MTGSRLRALVERAAPASAPARPADELEHCGLCGLPIPADHRHVMDVSRRELYCACHACSVLFDRGGAGGRSYRLVPDRCERLDAVSLDDLAWRSLGLPVDMAFFVRDAASGRMRAFYPSPAGATEAQLELQTWEELEAANPALAGGAPEVEAVLVNRTGGRNEAFLVGIDACYRLVATVRQHWRGLGGGEAVWTEIALFFDHLHARAGQRT